MHSLFTPKYEIEVYCNNCGYTSEIKIPKGMFVYDFLKSKDSKCRNCGCRVREAIDGRIDPEKLEREHKEELNKIRRRLGNEI